MQRMQGIIKRQGLTEEELEDIAQLARLCQRHDSTQVRIDIEELRRHGGLVCQCLLYYDDGVLIGCLTLFGLGLGKREITGMVHPDYRRRGIFRHLSQVAQAECDNQHIEEVLLITEEVSKSGKAFVASTGATFQFAEHEMVLRQLQTGNAFDERLLVEPARDGDIERYLQVLAESFGTSIEARRPMVTLFWHNPKFRFYLATLGEGEVSCREPVGCLRMEINEALQRVGIYSVGIVPAYQGRGYGRQMLEEAIRSIPERDKKTITLDVETDNQPAFRLYSSCGFQIKHTYAYYRLNGTLAASP
ncbi:GNAT family N-acetyltransferase [Ktedonospora formicarum]|uniref:Acetyltransferase n=1 Tax=Ktedonospora formicarum TaxID=2778364 RepID=A0A8J3HVD5_9CHLR|nr:GNAT family N-acetyltransferase [Ktedonospora formicarum]GHO44747.1 acetyltransferase [Ktedonospora formicarum]